MREKLELWRSLTYPQNMRDKIYRLECDAGMHDCTFSSVLSWFSTPRKEHNDGPKPESRPATEQEVREYMAFLQTRASELETRIFEL